jgi:cysteine dioxygenase
MATLSGTRLQALFDYLDGLTDRPDTRELADVLRRTEVTIDDVADWVRFDDRQYRRNLIRAGTHYHALALCWQSGQRSPIHDHARSICGVRVLEGRATETRFEVSPCGALKATGSFDMACGEVMVSKDSDIHQVSNLQAEGQNLVTLHIYAPPLLRMSTYSIVDRHVGEFRPVAFEHCEGSGI